MDVCLCARAYLSVIVLSLTFFSELGEGGECMIGGKCREKDIQRGRECMCVRARVRG